MEDRRAFGSWICVTATTSLLGVAVRRITPCGEGRSGTFNLLPLILFGVRTYDAGSIKLFRADVLAIPLISRSPFREAERIIRANRRGYRVGAIEVEHHDRRGGRATGVRVGRSSSTRWSICCAAGGRSLF